MSGLRRHAERRRLERVLDLGAGELAFTERLDPDVVATLRSRVEDQLAEQGEAAFRAVVRASRLLPDELVASIARHTFPPVLCAQLAGFLEPSRAASVASRLDVGFVADLAVHVDPRAVEHLVEGLPDETVVGTAAELAARGEVVTAGRLTGIAPTRVLPRLVDRVDDPTLADVLLLLEQQHDAVVAVVDDERLRRVAELVVAGDHRHHWAEFAELLGPEQRSRVLAAAPD